MAQNGKKISGGLGVEDRNNREEIQSTYKMANGRSLCKKIG
jgi:hypothetical protein